MIYYVFLFIVFFLGLSVGSFLNVVIYRLKNKKNIVFSRSECRCCEHELSALDLIPLFSFLFLRGKCRYCSSRISIQYPLVEFVTAFLFVLVFAFKGGIDFSLTYNASWLLPVITYWVYVSFLMVIFVYDLKHFLILNKVVLLGFIATLLGSLVLFENDLASALIGSMVFGFFILLIFVISDGKWIGGGDVKLAFLIGLMLGFPHVIASFFITFVGGAFVALSLMSFGKKSFGDKVPLGTFMTVGAVLSFFIARPMIQWYIEFLGF